MHLKSKGAICILLAALFFCTMFPFAALAETSGDYEYTVSSGGEAGITGYTGPGGDVAIPAALGGYPVTCIVSFKYCTSLRSITIPDGVIIIGTGAFYDCTSLESVAIPASVTGIGEKAFEGCGSLSAITVDEGNANYSSKDGVLFDKNKTRLIRNPAQNSLTSYTIPKSVVRIDYRAFWGCTSLKSVAIPAGLTSIGDEAFEGCTSLRNVTIPGSVVIISHCAFADCPSLESVIIPASVTIIGDGAFWSCEDLTARCRRSGDLQ